MHGYSHRYTRVTSSDQHGNLVSLSIAHEGLMGHCGHPGNWVWLDEVGGGSWTKGGGVPVGVLVASNVREGIIWASEQCSRQIEFLHPMAPVLALYPPLPRAPACPPILRPCNRFLSFALVLLRLLRPCQRFYLRLPPPLIYLLQFRSKSCRASSPSRSPSSTSVRYLIDTLL